MKYSIGDRVYLKTGFSREAVKIVDIFERNTFLKYVVSRGDGCTSEVLEDGILCKATHFPDNLPTKFQKGDTAYVVGLEEAKSLYNSPALQLIYPYLGQPAVIYMAHPLRGCYIVDCKGDRVCIHESLLKRS